MKFFTPENFAKIWQNGEVAWYSYEIANTPAVFNCPHCKQPIIQAQLKKDQKKEACMFFGDCFFIVPKDIPIDLLDKMLAFFKQRIIDEQKENNGKKKEVSEGE